MNNASDNVIGGLKQSLLVHWKQSQTLFTQANYLERWGYTKRAALTLADANQEVDHANVVLKRLQFFGVVPEGYTVGPYPWAGTMEDAIRANLKSVQEAALVERMIISDARSVGDEITAEIMGPLLEGSEAGIIQFEAELQLIADMGLQNFLTLQV